MSSIAFIGAGRIGRPVVTRLVQAGHDVEVVDVRPEVRPLVEAVGARWADSPMHSFAEAEVCLSALPGSPELRDALLGSGAVIGALAHLSPGATWIDLTSAAPDLGVTLAGAAVARRVRYLDCAVGGGPAQAEDGGLTLYVGGAAADLADARLLLETFADPLRIHHMGGAGAGYLTKLLVNQLWFGQAVAVAEVMLLGGQNGLDPGALAAALGRGPAGSDFIDTYLPSVLAGDHLPSFGLGRIVEELDSLCRLAHAGGSPWISGGQIAELYRQALASFGDVDGELLGAAYVEELARRTIGDRPPS